MAKISQKRQLLLQCSPHLPSNTPPPFKQTLPFVGICNVSITERPFFAVDSVSSCVFMPHAPARCESGLYESWCRHCHRPRHYPCSLLSQTSRRRTHLPLPSQLNHHKLMVPMNLFAHACCFDADKRPCLCFHTFAVDATGASRSHVIRKSNTK